MTRAIEVHGFKYPRRPTTVAHATLLGEDRFGRWLGIAKGSTWCSADRTRSGIFIAPLVKLIPHESFWSACFQPIDPIIDVDIILPVCWNGHVVEEVDLELDVLCNASGTVMARDEDDFARVQSEWKMPHAIALQAESTWQQMRVQVEQAVEPFNEVGKAWLSSFLTTNSR